MNLSEGMRQAGTKQKLPFFLYGASIRRCVGYFLNLFLLIRTQNKVEDLDKINKEYNFLKRKEACRKCGTL